MWTELRTFRVGMLLLPVALGARVAIADDEPGAAGAGPAESIELPGGLVVEGRPEGWTHLAFKMVPRPASGEVGKLPAAQRDGLIFRTVVLVDIGPAPGPGEGLALLRVGVGLAQPIAGRDTVVTMGKRDELGVAQTKAAKFMLYHAEEDLKRSRLLARTPTFALLGVPAKLLIGGKHAKIQLRYAIAVEPRTGALHRFVWAVADEPGAGPLPATLAVFGPDPSFESGMDLVVERAFGLVPKGWSLAMRELPPGRPASPSPALRLLTARASYTPSEAAELERGLVAELAGPGSTAAPPGRGRTSRIAASGGAVPAP